MDDKLIALTNRDGVCYVSGPNIVAISSPMTKGKQDESRSLYMRGGGMVWIHNTAENYAALRHLLPDGHTAFVRAVAATVPKVKRGPRLVKTPQPSGEAKEKP